MDADYFRTMFDHLYWARDRVLRAAAGLGQEEYARPNGFVYGSIRGILVHCLAGEVIWLTRCRGEAPARFISQDEVPTLEALASVWRDEEARNRAFLAGVQDDQLKNDVVFQRRDGGEFRAPLWHLLTLVLHHTTQHRSEGAEALSRVGRSPGDLDFLVYTAEAGARS